MKPKHYSLRFVNKLYSQIVKEDFEFLSIINIDDLSMTVLSKKDASIVPYLLLDKKTMTYDAQFNNFINYSVEFDDREQAKKDMNIEKVKEELQTKDTYSVNHSVKLPGGEILYKRWDFRKIDNHPNLILFTRKDVTYLISLDYNPLTNVYRKERAYIEMKIMILNHPDTEFSLVFVDIDDFKSYNYIFGVEEGDKLLTLMSKFFMNNLVENEIIGEVYADQFILLIPTSKLDEKIFNKLEKELIKNNENFLYNISVGINKITDRSLSLGEHLNRA